MCGRYNLITDSQALVDFFDVLNSLPIEPRYNIAPSQEIPVVRMAARGRELASMRWGLIPHWAKERKTGSGVINARAETVAEKPFFRNAFRQRRCLIPATGFYEWKPHNGGKQPYHFQIRKGGLFAFAGLWESWTGQQNRRVETCAIIVTEANEAISPIHDRMPVILRPEDFASWLSPANTHPELLQPLLRPCPASWVDSYAVSRMVSSPKNDGPECIAPLEQAAI